MKTNWMIGAALVFAINTWAQEYDDMYFRSKDREKLNASNVLKDTYSANNNYSNFKKKHFDEVTLLDDYNNPTDSYSARNINPEYISRSYSQQASEDEQNYFVEGYNPQLNQGSGYYAGANNWNNWNTMNSWNNRWMNPMFMNGWYGPMYNSWNNPYGFGWNDPWMNPYWGGNRFNSGWSLSASYFWGNSWGPGWNTWGNPYYGNMWGPSWYGGGWGWNNWNMGYYRPAVVVVNDGARTNYGKRSTGNSTIVNDVRTRNNYNSGARITDTNTGRRTQVTTDDYYVRPSRRPYTDSNSSYSNTGNRTGINNTNTGRSSNYNSGSNFNRNTGSSSSGFSTPSRSSSGGFSTPSRSSSGSSGSSSGGSRRGGN